MKNKSQIFLPERITSEYHPLMPLKKLRKDLQVISPKTYGKAKGDITRFLSKDTYHLSGFYHEKIGEKTVSVTDDGFEYVQDILSEKPSPRYEIIEGYCDYHFLRKDKNHVPILNDPPILAIHLPFENHCIPIHFGDRYKVYGNRLVIYHKYNRVVADTPWMRYEEFVHASKPISSIKKINYEYNGRFDQIFDDFRWYFSDCVSSLINKNDYEMYKETAEHVYYCLFNKLIAHASKHLTQISDGLMFRIDSVNMQVSPIDDIVETFEMELDMRKFFDPKEDISNIVTFKGVNKTDGQWETNSFINAIKYSMNDWVNKTNDERQKEIEERKQNAGYDDDELDYPDLSYFDDEIDY